MNFDNLSPIAQRVLNRARAKKRPFTLKDDEEYSRCAHPHGIGPCGSLRLPLDGCCMSGHSSVIPDSPLGSFLYVEYPMPLLAGHWFIPPTPGEPSQADLRRARLAMLDSLQAPISHLFLNRKARRAQRKERPHVRLA
jgi:hypothetical protein